MGAKLGLDAKIYRLTTGTRASWGTKNGDGMAAAAAPGSIDEIIQVKDLSVEIAKGEANVSTRGNAGWAAFIGTLKTATLNIAAVWDPADADQIALMKSFLGNSAIALAVLDGDKATTGVQGLWADFEVLSASKTENLEDGQMMNYTIKPRLSAVPPEWVIVTS